MKRILLLTSILIVSLMGGACAPSLELEERAVSLESIEEAETGNQTENIVEESVNQRRGIILPHHDLAWELIETAWESSLQAEPDLIVLIGPDHPGLADHPLIWTEETNARLQLSISPLAIDWIEQGLGQAAVAADHSIETPLKVFLEMDKEIPVLALTVPRGMDEELVGRIVRAIQELEGNCLLVGSVDFSHNLSSQESKGKDQESWTWIQNRELEAIQNAGNEYFDSPETIEILLSCLQGGLEQMIRSDSSAFGWSESLPGTSYQVISLYSAENS